MLHAIAKGGKSTIYRRYLGERDGKERKVYEEDEITSLILGPLDFLPAEDLHRFLRRVLRMAGYENFLSEEPPASAKMTLWDRRKVKCGDAVEPDVVITMKWTGGYFRILLIELKWRAPLSGDEQLHRQWQEYLDEKEREQALHLFIAPEVLAGAAAVSKNDIWDGKLILLPWSQIRSVFSEFSNEDSALGRWAALADKFFERVQISKFNGFGCIAPDLPMFGHATLPLFWHPHTFKGWTSLGAKPSSLEQIDAPLILIKEMTDDNH